MLDFIVTNYIIFIIIAIILLLGLFGYMMDKRKYEQYREEIANEERALDMLEAQPEVSSVATPVPVAEDPMTGK
mgnify:CR=1 FL=1